MSAFGSPADCPLLAPEIALLPFRWSIFRFVRRCVRHRLLVGPERVTLRLATEQAHHLGGASEVAERRGSLAAARQGTLNPRVIIDRWICSDRAGRSRWPN